MDRKPPPAFPGGDHMNIELCERLFSRTCEEKNPEQREAYAERLKLEWQRYLDFLEISIDGEKDNAAI